MKERIFICDFDGTVNRIDIGNRLVKALLPDRYEEINIAYSHGKITNFEIYRDILSPIISKDGDNLRTIIKRFLRETPGFRDFVRYAKDINSEIIILSDGFDIYINEFLKKYDIKIHFYANILNKERKGFSMNFPYLNKNCERCGTCKREVIRDIKKHYKVIIYIGDGQSDICSSDEVDVFFGKRRIFDGIKNRTKFYFYDFNVLKTLLEKKGRYRGVFFDLDGTLVDGFDIIYESFNYSLRSLGLKEIPIRAIKKVIGPALSEGFKRLVPENLVEEGVKLYRAYYKERYLERTILFAEAKKILQFLKDNRIIVGLITNKKVNFAVELLEYLKIDKYFDFIRGAEEGYLPKPESHIMESIMKQFKLFKDEVIYIGDSEIDGRFALNTGTDFIAMGLGLGTERNLYRYKPLTYSKNMNNLFSSLKFMID